MGRKPIDKVRIDNPELREDWVRQVAPHFFLTGLNAFNMNEISLILDVSKATLYKHYATHVEVLEEMVDMRVAQVAEFDMMLFDPSLDYWQRYRNAILYVCDKLSDVSATFLNDLKGDFPYLWERITVLQNYMTERLQSFYEQGIREGLVGDYDPRFLAISDRQFISQVCEPSFLKENALSLQSAINAYFQIKLKGIFKTVTATTHEPNAATA
jgi:AcrR family transcriptional regulator